VHAWCPACCDPLPVHCDLQEREERERQARTKAQLALAEKASELTLCVAQRESLETEMEKCGDELLSLTQSKCVAWHLTLVSPGLTPKDTTRVIDVDYISRVGFQRLGLTSCS
jgi:hypothetical protein